MEVMMDQNDFNKTIVVTASFTDIEMVKAVEGAFKKVVIDRLIDIYLQEHKEDIMQKISTAFEVALTPEEVMKIVSKAAAQEISRKVVESFAQPRGTV